MRADAYIVIDLETGSLCVTTSQSGERVFDGEPFVFRDSIVSVSLPGATVDPLSVSLGSGSLSVKAVSELTPGSILSSRSTIAGSRCRCWVELENGSIVERFLGQVDSASFGLNEDTIEFSMSPLQDISLVEYPSHGYMDEGRFVERVSFVSTEQGGFTQEISVLRPAMEFKSIFGTPSSPGFSAYQFQSLAVPLDGGGSYDPGDLYLFFSDNASDAVVPIIYGENPSVSVSPLAHYRVNISNLRYKIFIFPIAEHPIIGDPSLGTVPDFMLEARWNNQIISYQTFNNALGYTTSDGLGGSISYVTLPIRYKDSDDSYEEVYDEALSGLNESEIYFTTIVGKIAPGGGPISGLGDVLFDMYQSSGAADQSYIDWTATSPSLKGLNRFNPSIVINARSQGQTLQGILSSRLQGQFPFAVGSLGGTFAIQEITIPSSSSEPIRTLSYGVELSERTSISQTPLSDILNEVRVQFGLSGSASDTTQSLTLNRHNNETARGSFERWGVRPVSSISIPDVQGESAAYAVAEELLRRQGGVRIRASYKSFDTTMANIPLMAVVSINDEDVGLIDAPCIFLGYSWDDDLASISLSFLSLDMI